jgi:DNA polymerase elongation subunit (family B)
LYQAIYFDRDPNSPTRYHYYLRDCTKGINCFQYWPTVYKLDDDGEFETLFGDRCSPVKDKYDRKDPTILEKDIDRELVLLRDLYYKTDDRPSYHNIVYLDIEIEILGALTPHTIREANAEITAIALIDVSTKEKICFILDKEGKMEEANINGKIVIPCSSEKQLLSKFLNKWEQMDPTIVATWNGDFFDIPYLYYRTRKIIGDEVLRLSPIKKIEENINNGNSPIKIGLVNSLDYMFLLKKYIMKEESSYKLGDIGLKYAKLGKIEYNGSLDKLFAEDKEKYVDYNIRDVEIIEALEEKQKFIELTILISHLCHTPYESIYYNTALNEGAILTYLKRKNIVAPNKPTTTNPTIRELEVGDHIIHQRGTSTIEGHIYSFEDEKTAIVKTLSNKYIQRNIRTIRKKEGYAGGFLLEPKPAKYEWLYDEDVTSMYPFIMISLNMGVETIVGRMVIDRPNYNCWNSLLEMEEMALENPNKIVEVEIHNKKKFILKKKTIPIGKLVEIIKENNWAVSANGVFFRTDIKSSVAEILESGFNIRKDYKDKMKKAHKDGDHINQLLYMNYQMAYKIFINGNYGTNGINSYRFTDGYKIISSAITTTGQRTIQESIRYINEEIKKEINS